MGLMPPLHDVRGNTVSRPPVIIFVVCLLMCASATLIMGLFIQYADEVPNPEVKGKWLSFLHHLSSIKFCVFEAAKAGDFDTGLITQFIDGAPLNTSEEVSITISASVHLVSEFKKLPVGMVAAYGNVRAGDWAVLKNDATPLQSLKMAFVIPQDLTEVNQKNSCIILLVPSSFLPLSTRPSVCVPSFLNKTITHAMSLSDINPNGTDPNCETGASLLLDYNRMSERDFYLSKVEKWNIYLRLVHVSYFLFAFAVALICFALLRSRSYTSVVTTDKMTLNL